MSHLNFLICLTFFLYSHLSIADNSLKTASSNYTQIHDKCFGGSQADIMLCLEKELPASEQSLKNKFAEVENRIATWDESARYKKLALKALKKYKADFLKFSKIRGEFSSSLVGGGAGNSHEMTRLDRQLEINLAEVEYLDKMMAQFLRSK